MVAPCFYALPNPRIANCLECLVEAEPFRASLHVILPRKLITGEKFSGGHLQEIGGRIFNLERMYNLREGFTARDDTLPPRILHEPTFKHMTSGHPLDQLLPRYYKIRGWDAQGVPTARTLDNLLLHLRKMFEEDGQQQFLHTVRGVGLRFTSEQS